MLFFSLSHELAQQKLKTLIKLELKSAISMFIQNFSHFDFQCCPNIQLDEF